MTKRADRKALKEKSSERINYLMNQFTDDVPGQQQIFAEMCGVSKFSMSQYINGANIPGSVSAAKIANRCGVDPLWVMGMDVPMQPEPVVPTTNDLLQAYEQLSPGNRHKAEKYIDTLLALQQFDAEIENAKWVKDIPEANTNSVRQNRIDTNAAKDNMGTMYKIN